jgi:hypothetical protein
MLKILIKGGEFWDEKKQEFIRFKDTPLCLEHSLVSVSKWEAKYHKPFITNNKNDVKTNEEVLEYVKCMTLTQNVDENVYYGLSVKDLKDIREYIDDPMTATTITTLDDKQQSNTRQKPITSEVIYSWMIALNIPVEFQKWHLNRLLMLIRVCNINNSGGKPNRKMSKREIASRNAAINAARRKKFGTSG